MVLGAILTALVVVLQLAGSFVRFGPFAISLVLAPIVIGAATCGTAISTWLGFVFSVVVMMTDAAGFLAISVPGTVITVMLKGTLCGLVAGIAYNLLKSKNKFLAVFAAAVVCPIVNTGIFVLGCFAFFFDALTAAGISEGFSGAVEYIFIGMIGLNFIVEFATNLVLSPVIVRLLDLRKDHKK